MEMDAEIVEVPLKLSLILLVFPLIGWRTSGKSTRQADRLAWVQQANTEDASKPFRVGGLPHL